MVERPPSIGVLDSGIGGLSVLREIHHLLPEIPTIYFGDQGHVPYGERDTLQIRAFVRHITAFLLAEGARVIVIACNAASAASLLNMRDEFPGVPFVGMEPAVKPAVEQTRRGIVGVLTTQATANGPLYERVLARYAAGTEVVTQIAPELVLVAEANSMNTPAGRETIRRNVQPFIDAQVDQIVLACTHFPFLSPVIQEIVGARVELVDPSPAIARQTRRVWPADVRLVPMAHRYVTSGDVGQFGDALMTLIGIESAVEHFDWSLAGGF